jgi:hypothetical protein
MTGSSILPKSEAFRRAVAWLAQQGPLIGLSGSDRRNRLKQRDKPAICRPFFVLTSVVKITDDTRPPSFHPSVLRALYGRKK